MEKLGNQTKTDKFMLEEESYGNNLKTQAPEETKKRLNASNVRLTSLERGFVKEKCVSFIKFPYRQFSKLPVLYAESTLLIFEKGVLYPYAIF